MSFFNPLTFLLANQEHIELIGKMGFKYSPFSQLFISVSMDAVVRSPYMETRTEIVDIVIVPIGEESLATVKLPPALDYGKGFSCSEFGMCYIVCEF